MATISFRMAEDQVSVELIVHDFASPIPTEDDLRQLFKSSQFWACKLREDEFHKILKAFPKEDANPKQENDTPPPPPAPLAEPLVFTIAQKLDASLEIKISSDLMQATAHLVTAQGGNNYNQENILSTLQETLLSQLTEEKAVQLQAAGGIAGLKANALKQLYLDAEAAEPGTEFTVVLAAGVAPESGTPTRFEYLVTPLQERVLVPQAREDGTVDMHDLGEIETVDQGYKLVRRIPSKAGAHGFNLTGEVLPSIPPPLLPLAAGEGTAISESDPDLLVATRFGVPLRIDNGMEVSDVLMLDAVNLSVGNIDFDGTVIVKGDVAPKMAVKASKDVVVNGFAESCLIEAGGDITVRQGVIGKEDQKDNQAINLDKLSVHLIAGKDIHIGYAQAARLEAKENIHVSSQLLHCYARAGESVMVGEKGQQKPKLVGGRIHARRVGAGELGAPANSRVIIDFSDKIKSLEKELRQLQRDKEEKDIFKENVAQARRKLEVRKPTPELEAQLKKIDNTLQHVVAEITQLGENATALEAEIEAVRDEIHADIYGRLFPGVEFIICAESYRTRNEVPTCVVRFRNRQMIYDGADGKFMG